MIIACENCGARFRIDENRIKKEGSKVRCSLCKHVFTVYSPDATDPGQAAHIFQKENETPQETVALDSPPETGKMGLESPVEPEATVFDKGFDEGEEESFGESISEDIPKEKEEDFFTFGEDEEEREEGVADEISEVAVPLEGGDRTIKLPSRARSRARKILWVSVILLVLLLLAGVGVYFLAPGLLPDFFPFKKSTPTKETTDIGISRLTFPTVSGSFVESQKAGQLFVIRGMIKNDYPKARSHISIQGSLLDDEGKIVKTKMAYAGNSLEDNELKEMSLEEVEKVLRNRSGKENMNEDLQPGSAIPIMIVFDSLPENLSEFTVEAVRSIPGN